MLTERQKLTIEHLKNIQGITNPMDIIKFCIKKMDQSRKTFQHRHALLNGTATKTGPMRKKSHRYYQEIINHIAQGGELNPETSIRNPQLHPEE